MKLYGYRNGRTLRALWALEEAAVAYDFVEVDIVRGEGRSPWYLQIHPEGKVPVLVDEGAVISESAAICLHLADKYPAARLLPAPGTAARSQCYKWISFVLTELEPPLWAIAKHRFVLPVEQRVPAAIDTASWEFAGAARVLADGLGTRRFLTADHLTVADVLAAHTLMWARSARLRFSDDRLAHYLEGLLERPALTQARAVAAGAATATRTPGEAAPPVP